VKYTYLTNFRVYSKYVLPSPTGPLSKKVLATAISYANKEIMAMLKMVRTKVETNEGELTRDIPEQKGLELETTQWRMEQVLH